MSAPRVQVSRRDAAAPVSLEKATARTAYEAWDDGRRRGDRLASFLAAEIGDLSTRHVLDIGCAAGGISLSVAAKASSVVGIDVSPHEAFRAAVRAKEAPSPHRPLFASGSGVALPFRDGAFDLVLLNGVLEYMGRAMPSMLPRDAQRACLREAVRVLAPGGTVAIAIENRWYPPYVVRSPHQFVWGGLALPQRIAPAVTRRLGGTRIWEALHGYRALCSLVRDSGFSSVKGFIPVYGYHFPKAVVPADDRRALWRAAERGAPGDGDSFGDLAAGGRWGPLWFRAIAGTGLHRLLAPAFWVLGTKS